MLSTTPSDLAATLHAAFADHQRGNLAAAERGYRSVLKAQPDQPDANHLMGVLLDQMGRGEAGLPLISRAIEVAPDNPDAYCSLGRVLEGLGRFEEAAANYEAALQRRPDFVQAQFNLAAILRKLGLLPEAISCYQRLIEQVPDHTRALFNLGNALRATGQASEAIDCYRRALQVEPDFTIARVNLANALRDEGKMQPALDLLLTAVNGDPGNTEACLSLALMLRGPPLELDTISRHARQAILACLERDDLDHQDLVPAATSILLADAPVVVREGWHNADAARRRAIATQPDVSAFLADPLLKLLLSHTVLMSSTLESFMTGLRSAFLDLACAGDDDANALACLTAQTHWLAPLALQCFRNEYVFSETPAETGAVEVLTDAILTGLNENNVVDARLVMLACYRSLGQLPDAAALVARAGPDCWTELAQVQISEPLIELRLANLIPSLKGETRPVSDVVRNQYEENPYPRWTGVYRSRPVPFLENIALDVDPELLVDASPLESVRVLIAGCGTGLHAITAALLYEGAEVLAVDISRSSLGYASRRARELGIGNLEFLHADLLDLKSIGRRFDVIEAVGVLHHMADPAAGWRVLRDMLEPCGYMKVGLYSKLGRKDIVAARKLIAERGHRPTLEGIRRARAELLALPNDHSARRVVASTDFYSVSGVRDLLFHVQEQCFDLKEIATLIKQLELEPLGFVVDDVVRRDYEAASPEDPHAVSLSTWARFETKHPWIFQGMYQLWLRAIDS